MAEQERPPVVVVPPPAAPGAPPVPEEDENALQHPAKVMRIGSMVRQLLDEVRQAPLDDASRTRLREIYENSVGELAQILPPDLKDELGRLSLPFDEGVPSDAELRVAHAQLVGWLEGLFHGIQAMLFAQQMESRQRLEEMRRSLPPGPGMQESGPGNYL
ncbi:MAG: bacterial proteasome activator family protein [Actinobacteria bacterium]|nr:bacterial proteasome activator family protein [Actinomycetota bacterium]